MLPNQNQSPNVMIFFQMFFQKLEFFDKIFPYYYYYYSHFGKISHQKLVLIIKYFLNTKFKIHFGMEDFKGYVKKKINTMVKEGDILTRHLKIIWNVL